MRLKFCHHKHEAISDPQLYLDSRLCGPCGLSRLDTAPFVTVPCLFHQQGTLAGFVLGNFRITIKTEASGLLKLPS